MAINLKPEHRQAMQRHAEETYPHECCGFLLGKDVDGVKQISSILQASNLRDDSPQNRYLIDPKDFLRADRQARAEGLDILGIYHSHPDHPARPSEFDREHAWPYYSYIIFAVHGGKVVDAHSWLLNEDRAAFDEEEAAELVEMGEKE
ncbi:MAG: M67 family metallopeptidase [Armatimonadota bacterium]|nr:M67 family metallopeptidase [Armatimonadota bacterium]